MRHLGIDLGTRRVGLAMSDEGGQYATPFDVLHITAPEQATSQICTLIEKEAVKRVVLGLPINMDDSLGPAARRVVAWGKELARRCGQEVVYVDERLSSFEAEQTLSQRRRGGEKLTRKGKKERLDALAAAGFLQQLLDGRIDPIDVSST